MLNYLTYSKKLATLGIKGTGEYSKKEYKGILQQDIGKVLSSSIECRRDIAKTLAEKLLAARPSPSQPTGEYADEKSTDTAKKGDSADYIPSSDSINIIWTNIQNYFFIKKLSVTKGFQKADSKFRFFACRKR